METAEGTQLSQAIRNKTAEFKKLCEGLEEELHLAPPRDGGLRNR